MEVVFSNNFKDSLKEIGNNIKLSYYRIGENDEYHKLNSIWDERLNELSVSIDIPENKPGENEISIYYCDLSGNILGLAITFTSDLISLENEYRSLNHFVIKFPYWVVANILTDHNKKFLENKSSVVGVNSFLAREGKFEDEDYLTKDSFCKYIRHNISSLNNIPSSIDKNGELVFGSTQVKLYKEIYIEPDDLIGDENNYYVSNGSIVHISGYCVFDLYEVISSGKPELIERNCREDLSSILIASVNESGNIQLGGDNFEIDQASKDIYFKVTDKVSTIKFIGFISFNGLGGENITVRSNELNFTNYLNWTVKYSTRYFQEDNEGLSRAVLLFDTTAGNTGWDPLGDYSSRAGFIYLYSDVNVPESNIYLESEDIETFFKYFQFEVEGKEFDVVSQKFKYTIKISTTQQNRSNKCYPLNSSGKEVLLLNSIQLRQGRKIEEETKFYCVQRFISPLKLYEYGQESSPVVLDSIKFYGGCGVKKSDNLYVVGSLEGYDRWEIKSKNNDSILIDYSDNKIYKLEDIKSPSNKPINIYCKGSGSIKGEIGVTDIDELEIHRINTTTKSYDPFNWRDVIYCSNDNSVKIKLGVYSIYNNDFSFDTPDKSCFYYDEDTKDSYLLLTFDRSGETVHTIEFNYANTGGLVEEQKARLETENEEILGEFFNYDISTSGDSSGKISNTITIRSKALTDNSYNKFTWYPNISGKPIKIQLKSGIAKSNYIYLVIKPNLKGSIRINEGFGEFKEVNEIKYKYSKDNLEKNIPIYISSSVGEVSEFPYWEIVKKDPELMMQIGGDYVSSSYKLITAEDPTKYQENSEPLTVLTTLSNPSTTLDLFMDPLVIKRSSKQYYNKTSSFYDWKNQLVSDYKKTLDIKLEGINPSESLTVYKLDDSGKNLIQIPDEEYLDLSYIGLYKIYVKSNNRFRVVIDNHDERCGFYIYDPLTNTYDPNIFTMDEGSFNNVIGKEVYFVYLGKEYEAFEHSEQNLDIFIRFINLEDNTSTIVKLRRSYQMLSTTIRNITNPEKAEIFIDSDREPFNIDFSANLDTTVTYSDVNSEGNQQVRRIKSDIIFDSKQFNSIIYLDKGNTNPIKSRGYRYNRETLKISKILNKNTSYPINPFSVMKIDTKGNPETNENYLLYYLLPTPKAITDVTDLVKISSFADSSSKININFPTDGETEIIVTGEDIYNEVILGKDETKILDSFTIQWRSVGNLKAEIIVVENTGIDYEGDVDKTIGHIKIRTHVPNSKFILDSNGLVSLDYRQEEVDKIVKPTESFLDIIRLSPEHSTSSISPIGGNVVLSAGENKKFVLNTKLEDRVDLDAYLDEFSRYVSRIVQGESKDRIIAQYKSRLERGGYKGEIILNFTRIGGGSKFYLNQDCLNILSNFGDTSLPSNIAVKVGNKRVGTKNIIQKPWNTGIRIGELLYLGNNNNLKLTLAEWNSSSANFNASVIEFPKLYTSSPTADSNIKRIDDPVIEQIGVGLPITRSIEKSFNDNKIGLEGKTYIIDNITENLGEKKEISKFKLSDKSGENSVIIEVFQNARDFFDILGSSVLPEQDESGVYLFDTSRYKTPKELLFSATGDLLEDLYIATDAPESLCNFIVNSAIFSVEGIPHEEYNGINATTIDSVDPEYLGDAIVDGNKEIKYRFYRLGITSRIVSVEFDKDAPLDKYFGHNPSTGNFEIYLGEEEERYKSPVIELDAYYGSANLEISGPHNTILSDDEIYQESFIFAKYSNNQEDDIDTKELLKYQGSLYKTNTKKDLNIEQINNTLYLKYDESKGNHRFNLINASVPGENLWDKFGYYCGFRLKPTRKEWERLPNGKIAVRECEAFELKYNSGIKLITPRPESKTYFLDHLIPRGYPDNPDEGITEMVNKYFDSSEHYSTDISLLPKSGSGSISDYSSSNSFGLLMTFKKEMFRLENSIYHLVTSINISGNSEDIPQGSSGRIEYYDPVTFKLDLKLILK